MSERIADLGTNTDVVLVTFTTAADLASYDEHHHLAFSVVRDPERTSYRAYGLGRGAVGRVWGWRMVRRYAELFRRDGFAGLRRPTEDTLQLGGDFVIGPDGRLVYGFWSAGPDDRPPVTDLIDAVRTVN